MTQTLFFYGSLCHVPLLEIVLGRSKSLISHAPAVLQDHRSTWVAGEPFPMIAAADGEIAEGLVVRDLSQVDLARLRFYEGGFDYDLQDCEVDGPQGREAAQVFFPAQGRWMAGDAWDLNDWTRRYGQMSCLAAREVMSHFGSHPAEHIAGLLPFFRARAWARQMAADPAPATLRSGTHAQDIDLALQDGAPDGFFRLQSFDVSFPRFDGRMSQPVRRSAFVAYDAALVLPYDPVSDRVMLVEQMRYGPLMRGDPRPWTLEPIAGLVDAGEAPVEAARREAVEEAGLELSDIRPMLNVYGSPGYSTEFFHCFIAICALSEADAGLGGLDHENEDIRSHVLPFDAAMALLDSGEITGGPVAMMLLWLARARAELRRGARM